MTDAFSEAKEHGRHNGNNFYNIGDIVELRDPKGILGCIKYIGPKLNKNGELISSDIHYVIQLEEYVGNGNGSWNGYQYIPYLRPDGTMHICKYSNIRCKRTSDDILKALYNILRSNNKLKKQIKQQQNYINELQDINYKFEQHLQSQTYYLIPKTNYKYSATNLSNLPNLPLQSIPANSTTNLNTQTPHQLEFNNNIISSNINNNIPSHETSSTSTSKSTESIEMSDKVKSEKWVGLPKQNIITPPPMNINANNTNMKHNKFNNSLTLDILQQKTRRSHRRNQSQDYEIQNNNKTHRTHRSNTFAADDGLNINEITPAPYTPPLPPVTASNVSMITMESMDNSSEYYNVNVKQKKRDIKYGTNNQNTAGKLQLYQREIEKQKSMDKMKNKKVVKTKVNMFEKMNEENVIQSNYSNDRKSIRNESDSIQKIESDSIQNHMENNIENDIGNYDDSTMIIHTDQLIT